MPRLVWFGLNTFRLAAVVFLIWGIIAQFLSLADEIKAQTPAVASNSTTTNQATDSAIVAWDSSGNMTVSGSSAVAAVLSSSTTHKVRNDREGDTEGPAELATRSTSTIPSVQRPETTPPIRSTPNGVTAPTTAPMEGLIGGMKARRGESVELQEGGRSEGKSSAESASAASRVIEDGVRGDVAGWIVSSRLIIAGLLCICIAGQVGVPEMKLYKHVAWLGPQSTPLTLGGLQSICAIEILRSQARSINLVPAYAILGIGTLNTLIGFVLLFLGRKLPKHPPPPLYFNHAQRLLFWTPDPPCYATQFLPPLPIYAETNPAEAQSRDHLPRSNGHDIGLDNSDDEDEKGAAEPRYIEGARSMTAEEDVTRGGYPTFAAGSGIGQAGRHVPAGTLEQGWGAPIRFDREDDRVPHHRPSRDSTFESIQVDLIEGPRPAHTLPRPQRKLAKSKHPKPPIHLPDEPALHRTPSAGSVNSAYSGISRKKSSNRRKSVDWAANDEESRFPLPPSRALAVVPNVDVAAQRKSHIHPPVYIAPSSTPLVIPSHRSAHFKPPPARTSQLDPHLQISTSPYPTAEAASAVTPKTALSTPSPISAQIAQAQHGQVTAGHLLDQQVCSSPELLDESGSETESPIKQRAHSMTVAEPGSVRAHSSIKRATSVLDPRPVRGVRFDLTSVEEESEPVAPPRSGLKILGINFHPTLPAILSPAGSWRNSISSISESGRAVESKARPLSENSISSMLDKLGQNMGDHDERRSRRSMGSTVGNKYLDGGSEVTK